MGKNRLIAFLIIAESLFTGGFSEVVSQDDLLANTLYEQIEPSVPEKMEPAAPEEEITDENIELCSDLRAIAVYETIEAAREMRKKWPIPSIEITNPHLPLARELANLLEGYLHQPLTLASLYRMQSAIVKLYRLNRHLVVRVGLLPDQDISSGRLVFIIMVGRLGTATVTGAKFFSNERLQSFIRSKPGEYINSATMFSDMDWLNGNPFRSASLFYEQGKKPGETDVVIEIKDKPPLRVYSSYQVNQYEIAGDTRYSLGFNMGNLWNIGHQLNAQLMNAQIFDKWWAVSGNYIWPLPWRNTLRIFGSCVGVKPAMPMHYKQKGKGWYLGGRYELPLKSISIIDHTLTLGYDFSRTNNFLTYTQTALYSNFSDISQFIFEYEATVGDSLGSTTLDISVYYSPGNMTRYNTTVDFELQRAKANCRYMYEKFSIKRITVLPKNWRWSLYALWQQTEAILLPSEQFCAGGYATVRGYAENIMVSDKGLLLKNELISPEMKLLNYKSLKESLQFYLFCDLAWGVHLDRSVIDKKTQLLASIGPGGRYVVADNIEITFSYGWQLEAVTQRVSGYPSHSRGHFSAQVSF